MTSGLLLQGEWEQAAPFSKLMMLVGNLMLVAAVIVAGIGSAQ